MTHVLDLKHAIVYGPVNSRRLGRSLGINLMPPQLKWCSCDCLYCQYGWTPTPVDPAARPQGMPTVLEVTAAVETALQTMVQAPAYLTFSGHGESTLHPDFPAMVAAVATVRNRLAPKALLAILSNASTIGSPAVQAAVMRLDCPIMKLDAGSAAMYRQFNRPLCGGSYADIVAGLGQCPGLTIQALFAGGPRGNLGMTHTTDWIERLREIRPRRVQIYTLSRPFPSHEIAPAPAEELQALAGRVRAAGLTADVF
jgi:wyosine [tRNA(Phe)-imidazoG37] synthetase (radical SAM superfamily)